MAHIVWYSDNMELILEEKTQFQWLKLSKNMQFGAEADIMPYKMKFW